MFTWLNKQGVQSDEGFAVQFLDRFTMEYREGLRTMKIPVEIGFASGRPAVNIFRTAFSSWDGEVGAISDELQVKIARNFRGACEFQEMEVVFY